MINKYLCKGVIITLASFFCFITGNAQNTLLASENANNEPINIVKNSDRVPLYPSNGHDADQSNFVYPTVVRKNGTLTVFASRRFDVIDVISANGVLMSQQNIKGSTGRFDIVLKTGPAGINYVRLRNKETMIVQKIVVTE